MQLKSISEIATFSAVAAAFINWPLLRLLWLPNKHDVIFWMTALCGLLSIYTPYIFLLKNAAGSWNMKLLHGLLIGLGVPTLIAADVYLFAKLLEQYIMHPNAPYLGSTIYVSLLAIGIPSVLAFEFYNWLVSTISKIPTFDDNNPSKAQKYAFLLILSGLIICYYFISKTVMHPASLDTPICRDLERYWEISIPCLGVMLVCCVIAAFLWGDRDIQQKVKTILLSTYFFLYFPFYSYWISKGIGFLRNPQVVECHESMVPIIIIFIIKFSSVVVGIVTYGGFMVLGFVFVITTLTTRLLPNSLESAPAFKGINLKADKFRPENHDENFIKEEVCSICLEKFAKDQQVSYWPQCRHVYHFPCLEKWVKKKFSCPICHKDYIEIKQKGL